MSNYINVGARLKSDQSHVPTKKALKDLLAKTPGEVVFYPTAMFGSQSLIPGNELPTDGSKLQVVGPDPEKSRKWYATVERTAKGVKVF